MEDADGAIALAPAPAAPVPSRLRIREAVDADVPALRRLVNAAFAEHAESGVNFTGITQDDEETRQRMRGRQVYLVCVGRKAAGTVSLETIAVPDVGAVLEVSQFAVHPDFKGRGIGSFLLEFAENRAREIGAVQTRLSTADSIAHLLRFYENRGYEVVGRFRRPGKNYDSLLMAKPTAG